jgi:uncharacterized protein
MATDLIRYDLLVQDALRAVMRKVLSEAAHEGLPGEHHFFITFKTRAPGVRLSNRMREQYPKEMTIVLQHQFWDLTVGDQAFEVGLSFHGKSETLLIPFEAVTGFFDPSVEFGLKFEPAGEEGAQATAEPSQALPSAPAAAQTPVRAQDKAKPRGSGSEPAEVGPALLKDDGAPKRGKAPKSSEQAKVISIETFRKKP